MTQINTSTSEKIILGIDPGTRFLGYGLLRINQDKVTILQYGVLNLTKNTLVNFQKFSSLSRVFSQV